MLTRNELSAPERHGRLREWRPLHLVPEPTQCTDDLALRLKWLTYNIRHQMLRLRTRGAVPPTPHTTSRHAEQQF
jgi:hypothetical protein